MSRLGAVLVVSAPSGAGKSTVVAAVRRALPNLGYSVSLTTRAPRPGEHNGAHYHFVTRDDFLARVVAGEMLEHAEVFDNLYGTSARVVGGVLGQGRDVLLEIDIDGAAQVKARWPQAVLIFILPPDMAELECRLRRRATEDEATIARRLARAREEIRAASRFDYLIVNRLVAEAAAQMQAIIVAEGLRVSRNNAMLAAQWGT